MNDKHPLLSAESRFIAKLIESAHAIATSTGWHSEGIYDTPARVYDRVLALLALTHSEVVEASMEPHAQVSHVDAIDIPHDLHTITDMLCVDKLKQYARDHQLTTKPEGYHFELADVVIRLADLWGWVGAEVRADIRPDETMLRPQVPLDEPTVNRHTPCEVLGGVHAAIAAITEEVRVKSARPFHERIDMCHVIRACVLAAAAQDFVHAGAHRLLKAIVVKMAFNTTRPYKHGKVV